MSHLVTAMLVALVGTFSATVVLDAHTLGRDATILTPDGAG